MPLTPPRATSDLSWLLLISSDVVQMLARRPQMPPVGPAASLSAILRRTSGVSDPQDFVCSYLPKLRNLFSGTPRTPDVLRRSRADERRPAPETKLQA